MVHKFSTFSKEHKKRGKGRREGFGETTVRRIVDLCLMPHFLRCENYIPTMWKLH